MVSVSNFFALAISCLLSVVAAAVEQATATSSIDGVLFSETFNDDVLSTGKWIKSADERYQHQSETLKILPVTTAIEGLNRDNGLTLSQENKHYGVSTKFVKPLDTKGKEFVVQYDLKLTSGLDCGGAYIKLLRDTPELDLTTLNGDTPYTIMFGPDKCATNNRVHFIIQHQNPITKKWEEKHFNSTVNIKADKVHTHLYTLVIKQNNDFEIYIDKRLGKKGNLLTHMRPPVNPSLTIDDPTDSKPSDWIDDDKIDDPNAKKPDDWDEHAPKMIENPNAVMPKGWNVDAPEQIPDPKGEKPEGWDDEEDGVWEAPLVDNPACNVGCGEWKRPMMPNPAYKGTWKAPKIDNPAYKGLWSPVQIPNPEYFEDKNPVENLAPMGALAVEVWTTTAGIHFDNFLVASSLKAAFRFADLTYGVKDALETKKADVEKREEERKKAKKQREAKKKKSNWMGKMEVLVSEWKEFVDDNQFMTMGFVMALMLLAALVVVGMPEKPVVLPRQRQVPSTASSTAATIQKKNDTTGSGKKTPRSNGKKHD